MEPQRKKNGLKKKKTWQATSRTKSPTSATIFCSAVGVDEEAIVNRGEKEPALSSFLFVVDG